MLRRILEINSKCLVITAITQKFNLQNKLSQRYSADSVNKNPRWLR